MRVGATGEGDRTEDEDAGNSRSNCESEVPKEGDAGTSGSMSVNISMENEISPWLVGLAEDRNIPQVIQEHPTSSVLQGRGRPLREGIPAEWRPVGCGEPTRRPHFHQIRAASGYWGRRKIKK